MAFIKIAVECYAGSRANERPRRVIIEGQTHIIARMIDTSIEESADSRAQTYRYKLLTDENLLLEIICTRNGEWLLESIKRTDD